MVQWLRLQASTAWGMGLIPGQGSKILHASRPGQKKKMLQDVKVRQVCSKACNERGQSKTGTEAWPIHLGFMPAMSLVLLLKLMGSQ